MATRSVNKGLAIFENRREAGLQLAQRIAERLGVRDSGAAVVVAIPPGGAAVGFEISRNLHVPFDVIVARGIGACAGAIPGISGAVAEGGVSYIVRRPEDAAPDREGVTSAVLTGMREVRRLMQAYRGSRLPMPIRGRTVLLVTDVLAAPEPMVAAARSLRKRGAGRVILVAPVCAAESARVMLAEVDELVCLVAPKQSDNDDLLAQAFGDIDVPNDEEVRRLVDAPRDLVSEVKTAIEGLDAELILPLNAFGLVLIPVNWPMRAGETRRFTQILHGLGIATVAFDAGPSEQGPGGVLASVAAAEKLIQITNWANAKYHKMPIGYFAGATEEAAGAVAAAARLRDAVVSVVLRGARRGFSTDSLQKVAAPVLFIAAGEDSKAIEINRQAMNQLRCESDLEIIPGASGGFAEPGAMEAAAHLAADWFVSCFRHSSELALRGIS